MSEQPYDGMPVTDDAGEVVGHAFQADAGEWVMIRNGEIVTAIDADGNDLDPREFQVDGDPYDDPRLDEIAARQDEFEQRLNEAPPPAQPYVPGPTQEDIDAEYASMLGREIENVEAIIGRELSQAEMHRIYADHSADVDAGIEPDLVKSVTLANLADTGTHAGRVQLMSEVVREAGDVDHNDPRPERVEPASSDPGDVRRAAITNAVHGHEPDETDDYDYSGAGPEEME